VHEREPGLIAQRVVAPDLGDGHVVFGTETPGDVDGRRRNVQVKRGAGAAEVRPLRHGFEVVDRFPGLHFDDAFESVSLVLGGQNEIRKHLGGANLDPGGLFVPDVHDHLMFALQLCLKKPDDAIVLELFSDRPDQNRTQVTSGEPGIVTHKHDSCIGFRQEP